MKKAIAVLVILVILSVVFYFFNNMNAFIKTAIEHYGSEATKTQVSVERVDVNIGEGLAGVYGLNVRNPIGFAQPNVLSLGEVSSKINLESLGGDIVVIDEVNVLAPKVFFELNQEGKINFNELKKNLTLIAKKADGQTKTETGTEEKPVKLILNQFAFLDADVNVVLTPLNKSYTLSLPNIQLDNLGAPDGASPGEIAKQVLTKLSEQVIRAVQEEGVFKDFLNLKAMTKQKFHSEKENIETKAKEKLEAEKDRAKEKLKGLFNVPDI